jgi:putative Ca2+/H+ antiporter (TMEM165/GDT1 family)
VAALLASFVAAFLCAWGDRTQLIAATLAAGTKKPGQVLAGLILAALVSNVVAAFAGVWIAGTINLRAMTLLTALALLFGGLFGLIPRKQKPESAARLPLLATFILCLAAEIGDRIQFLTLAFAGRFDSAPLARPWGSSRPAFLRCCLASGCSRQYRCAAYAGRWRRCCWSSASSSR